MNINAVSANSPSITTMVTNSIMDTYCPSKVKIPVEQWMDEIQRKRAEKDTFVTFFVCVYIMYIVLKENKCLVIF